eukprot:15464435-Alexandrium_andersonii.AAC.1
MPRANAGRTPACLQAGRLRVRAVRAPNACSRMLSEFRQDASCIGDHGSTHARGQSARTASLGATSSG